MKYFSKEFYYSVWDNATPPERSLFTDEDALYLEQTLLSALDHVGEGGLVVLDFTNVRVASAAARRLLRRPIARITSGELTDRYLVLSSLGESEYGVEVMLEGEGLTAVAREGTVPRLIGKVDLAISETYDFLLRHGESTASDIREQLKLSNTSTATNRVTALAKMGLARRIGQQPASGGGREFVYVPVR